MPRPAKKAFKPMRNTYEKPKADKGAPCVFFSWNEKKRATMAYHPAVSCNMNCDSCGFNPKEQERRLSTGAFKPAAVIDKFTDKNGKEKTKPALVKQLVFRKVETWE